MNEQLHVSLYGPFSLMLLSGLAVGLVLVAASHVYRGRRYVEGKRELAWAGICVIGLSLGMYTGMLLSDIGASSVLACGSALGLGFGLSTLLGVFAVPYP